ncbi:MAG: bile acid:sodium symporter family protein [bacterium]|nr:bile acid:sodium symporter family protein [bacterium]
MNKILSLFTKLMLVWVLLAGIIGYLQPGLFTGLKNYTDWLFAFTMLGIGAILNVDDFRPVFRKPHLVLLGILAQFAIMPASGYFVARMLHLSKDLTLGLIMVGSVPGAMASNVISYLARADVAYSIALTTASTTLAPVLTPAFVYLFGHTIIEIKFWAMFLSIIKMVILPLLVGFGLRHFFKKQMVRLEQFFPALSTLFIAFICGLVVALNQKYIVQLSLIVFVAISLMNFLGLLLGYLAGVLYGFDKKRRRTLSFEVGMQNAGLGAVLSLKHFSAQAALPNALFATWCILTASILAMIWSKSASKSEEQPG